VEPFALTSEAVDNGEREDIARPWMAAVHAWARARHHVKVDGPAVSPGPGRNYYQVRVTQSEGLSVLLLNAPTRVVTASSASEGRPAFVELDAPEVFTEAGFVVASPDELHRDVTSQELAALTADQRADVEYHLAQTVGDLLFNWFD
jgi:hypothetical protein